MQDSAKKSVTLAFNPPEAALYIVATPIGNLEDITLRALSVLGAVDLIAAEDTRHSRKLLDHYSISTPMISVNEHNEDERAESLIEKIKQGQSIALISDAGTPLISDPGFNLVRHLRAEQCKVIPIPGSSAVIAALSAAGLPTDRFVFEGFLSAKASAAEARLKALADETRTMVFFESRHRIAATLTIMANVFGTREAVLARELTKRFEGFLSGSLEALRAKLQDDPVQSKGEFVVLVHGAIKTQTGVSADAGRLLASLLEYLPLKTAAAVTASHYGGGKKRYYELGLTMKK